MSSSTANLVAGSLASVNTPSSSQKETKPKKLAQYLAAITATLGAFALGNSIGWSSPASRRLQGDCVEVDFVVSPSDFAWIGSLLTVGAALSTFPAGIFADWIGRKTTMFYISFPYIAGWFIITFANGVEMLYVGRIITGFCGGVFSVACPMYIGEIADKEVRGTLGAFFQLMVVAGIEFTYVVGAFLPYLALNLLCTSVPVIFAFLFFWMPETPQYHLKRGRTEEARRALQWLRGVEVNSGAIAAPITPKTDLKELRVDSSMGVKGSGGMLGASDEFEAGGKFNFFGSRFGSGGGGSSSAGAGVEAELMFMHESVEYQQERPVAFLQTFSGVAAKRALLISAGLMATQQLSGINAVVFYTEDLFEAASSALESRFSVMVVGAVQLVSTVCSVLVIDRLGRRPLMMISNGAMALCTLLLGFYFFYSEDDKSSVEGLGWLPILIVCVYFVSFSIGSGPVPWLMVGEIFPPEIKGTAAALSSCINWILAFIVTRFYGNLVYALNVSTTFWIFTVLLLLGLIFVVFVMPETRGYSLEEIQEMLGGEPHRYPQGTPMSPDEPGTPVSPDGDTPTSERRRQHDHHHKHHHRSHHRAADGTKQTVETVSVTTTRSEHKQTTQ